MTVIFNNFIVPRISLSLSSHARERKLYTASFSLSAHPDNHSFSARPSAPPREMTEAVGKEVTYTRCKYPSNYAIPARRGSIARRGKVCCCCYRCFFFSLQHHLHLPHLSSPRRVEHTSDSSSDILVTCLFCNYYVLAPGIPMYIIAD